MSRAPVVLCQSGLCAVRLRRGCPGWDDRCGRRLAHDAPPRLLFGIPPVTAVGTALFFAAATKTAGTLVHGLRGTVRWGIVGRLACGSVPATGLTLLGLSYFDVHGAALNQLTTLVLAGALFLAADALIFRQPLIALYAAHVGELGSRSTGALTIGVGALLGMLVSATVQ